VSEQVSSLDGGQAQDGPPPGPQPTEPQKGNAVVRWFKRQSLFGKIRIVGVALILLVGVPYGLIVGSSAPASADVGDCMNGQTAETLKIVECTDASAEWVVIGRLNEKVEADFTDDSCAAFPQTEISYWEAQKRRGVAGLVQGDPKGFILCLGAK